VTIRTEDRPVYFRSLQRAQVDREAEPFARLILEYVQRAVRTG